LFERVTGSAPACSRWRVARERVGGMARSALVALRNREAKADREVTGR
jgi:hypothetical protein